jgi:hypothetical protein
MRSLKKCLQLPDFAGLPSAASACSTALSARALMATSLLQNAKVERRKDEPNMRYITIPGSFVNKNAQTDEPLKDASGEVETISFAQSVKGLCANIGAKGKMEVLSLLDLRMKLSGAVVGEVVELTDEWWGLLAEEARKPTGVSLHWLFSCRSHIEAIVNAPTKKPESSAAPKTGAELPS